MEQNTVKTTVQMNLCCGCGICKAICPKGCISWRKKNGLYIPAINEEQCVNCGLCASVCPGLGHPYEVKETAEETVTGPIQATYNAWSRDAELRHVGASGGVVSTMIRELLKTGAYDGAFCLDSYDYRQQLKTRLYTADEVSSAWDQANAPKSRYLPVSHENAVAYMKENRNARIIFVGTSCAVRGLRDAMKKLHLDPDQYLLIGLFCDKVFNYNVIPHWQDQYCQGNALVALHFKNKESGGWPGDMKFFPESGEAFYVPLDDRTKAKPYFSIERCMYCLDKLNVCADISIGDNYTEKNSSELGSNSVIVRTQAGAAAWATVKEALEVHSIGIEDIQRAQAVAWRLNNLYCGDLKMLGTGTSLNLNPGVPREQNAGSFKQIWKVNLQKLMAGAIYDIDPTVLQKQIIRDGRKMNPAIHFAKRAIGYIKRRIR